MNMTPEVIKDVFVRIETNEETYWTPEECVEAGEGLEVSALGEGHFARWTMPGYMDCTEWNGPYKKEVDALWNLFNDDLVSQELSWTQWLIKYGYDFYAIHARNFEVDDIEEGTMVELTICIPVM